MKIILWTKKLDDIHIEIRPREPSSPAGLCGKPLLGNDYIKEYKDIDKQTGRPRKVCVDCMKELQRIINSMEDL